MAIDIKNYLIQKFNESFDTSENSALNDLVINPLSSILSDYNVQLNNLVSKFSKLTPGNLDKTDIEALSLNYLISPIPGAKATGAVILYFTTPVSITIPIGTIVTSGNKKFEVINNYTVSKNSLIYEAPFYKTNAISITAIDYGDNFNLPSDSSFSISGYFPTLPAKISNVSPISGGVNPESNSYFYNRLKASLFGLTLSSPLSIDNYIKSLQPSVISTEVIGYNNPLMYRDIVYNFSDINSFNKSNFEYVKSGVVISGKDKLNKAYYGQFIDTNSGTGIGFPSTPSVWSLEFNNDMYINIYKPDDLNFASTAEYNILSEFNSSSSLPVSGKGSNSSLTVNGWLLKDGASIDNEIDNYYAITSVDGVLRLGKRLLKNETEILRLKTKIEEVKTSIKNYSQKTSQKTDLKVLEAELKILLDTLNDNIENLIEHNPSPVIIKQIDTLTGIVINTDFSTTDSTNEGSMSYISVFKNNVVVAPQDGFGIGWKKQPEYLIRLDKNEYPSNSDEQLKKDLDQFYDEYKINGNAFRGKLSGLRGTIHVDAKTKIWKYNIFVVDNNLLEDEIWISSNQIWNQSSGRDQFLSAGKVWIEQNVEYSLKIEISQNMGIKAWVDYTEGNTPSVSYGPTTPAYIPDANTNIIVNGQTATRNFFGFGVVNTHNYEWFYKNVEIVPIVNVFPGHLFKMDVSSYNTSNGITYSYSGFAFDPNESELGHSSVQLGVFNQDSQAWEVLGTNTNDRPEINPPYNYTNNLITGDIPVLTNYVDINGFIYFAAMPTDDSIQTHELRSYYFEIDDGKYVGVHRGNAIDIYVNDPDNIATSTSEVIVTNEMIDFTDNQLFNGYIQEIVSIAEAYSNISIDKSEWAIVNSFDAKGSVYSERNKFKIVFNSTTYNNAKLRITYKYWSAGVSINSQLQTSGTRQPAIDYLLKVSPPVIVSIGLLNYIGSISENDLKIKIVKYINNLNSKIFEKSDLINYLYSQGVSYVDLNMVINIRKYDSEMNVANISLTEQRYVIDNISNYFTDINELYGVNKL